MTKEKLIEENEKLKTKIEELEKQLSDSGLINDVSKLYEIINILLDERDFYRKVIINLTEKQEEENEYR